MTLYGRRQGWALLPNPAAARFPSLRTGAVAARLIGGGMPRKQNAARSALRQAQIDVKQIRIRARKLLAAANTDLKGYRKQLRTLQKQGIISKRITPKRHKPTRYMVGKLKKFKPVALGHELAVPIKSLSTHRLREYVEKGLARVEGKFVLRPKTAAKQKLRVEKDHLISTTSLEKGDYETILFPARLEDMHDILNWLNEHNEQLMDIKGPRDQFGFQLQGYNSRRAFPNIKEMIAYLQQYDGTEPKYRGNIFNGHSKQVRQEFVAFRFRPSRSSGPRPDLEPYFGKKTPSKRKPENKREKEIARRYKLEQQRQRKARQRVLESNDERERRLEKQRNRDRARSNDRTEKRLEKRLMKGFKYEF